MLFIAQSAPDVSQLGTGLLVALVLGSFLSIAVTIGTHFVTRREMMAMEKRLEKLELESRQDVNTLFTRIGVVETSAATNMKEVASELGKLTGAVGALTQKGRCNEG